MERCFATCVASMLCIHMFDDGNGAPMNACTWRNKPMNFEFQLDKLLQKGFPSVHVSSVRTVIYAREKSIRMTLISSEHVPGNCCAKPEN
jgi:hypothetical protein